MLADKITAILSIKRFRRPKDIYDLYCISETFDFEPYKVHDYILKRTNGVGAEWDNFPFSEVAIRKYEHSYNKLSVKSIYKVKEQLTKPSFVAVLERFSVIVNYVKNCDGNNFEWVHTAKYFKLKGI